MFFDINLSEEDAQQWNLYLKEGLFIDQNSKDIKVHLMTYNAPLRVFGYLEVDFEFSQGGSIQVRTTRAAGLRGLSQAPNPRPGLLRRAAAAPVLLSALPAGSAVSCTPCKAHQTRARLPQVRQGVHTEVLF